MHGIYYFIRAVFHHFELHLLGGCCSALATAFGQSVMCRWPTGQPATSTTTSTSNGASHLNLTRLVPSLLFRSFSTSHTLCVPRTDSNELSLHLNTSRPSLPHPSPSWPACRVLPVHSIGSSRTRRMRRRNSSRTGRDGMGQEQQKQP